MKIETLQVRVDNAKKKITKVTGTLERHNARLEKIKKSLEEYGVDVDNYNAEDYKDHYDVRNLMFDYELKLEDIRNNEKKLKELNTALEKAINSLEVEKKKKDDINNLIPECLIQFLDNWKNYVKEFYIDLANKYLEVKFKKYEVNEEELKKPYRIKTNYITWEKTKVKVYKEEDFEKILNSDYLREDAEREIRDYYIEKFKKEIFNADLVVLNNIIDYDTIKLDVLEKILDDEIEVKKELFIERIREVVGVIEDLSELYLGDNGEINGIVQGKKCKAKVQTIGAGGYNIQCYHYRVLVNKIK